MFNRPRARLVPRFAVATVLGVAGCTHANPAFEPGEAAGEAATGEWSTGGLGSGSPTSSEPRPSGTKTSGRPPLTTGPDDTGSEGTTTSEHKGSTTSERERTTVWHEDTGFDSTQESESTDGVVDCDLLGDDCEDGYGCVYIDDVAACVVVDDTNGPGNTCDFVDGCASGLACVSGVGGNGCQNGNCCAVFCELGARDCPNPYACFPFFGNPVPVGLESVGVCLTP